MKNKVKLRGYRESDFEFLHELLSDEASKKYFPFMYTTSKEQSMLRLKARLMDEEWGIDTRYVIEDIFKRPVGEISGKVARDDNSCMEMAILVHPKHRGKGFAKDGTIAFIKKMNELKPHITKFRMEIAESNKASQAVAKKMEFILKGVPNENSKMQYWESR